ncbi:MAG: hypothetical protein DRP30_01895 [Thermotoga sp.]|nr:MAG: hypothetical protein DRP30_01895 [Thermotoga sp.]
MVFIGVDVGTSSTKAVAVNERGEILSTGLSKSYPVEMPKPTWAQQSPKLWVNGFTEAVRNCVDGLRKLKEDVVAMGVSGLYGGSGVPLDSNMEPLHPALIWMDKRAVDETRWLKEEVGWERIFELSGNYVDPYYGYTKLLWLKRNLPDLWKRTRIFLTPKDYIIYLITGDVSIDLSSAGNIGGIFDIRRREWSKEAMNILGFEPDKFPEKIVESTAVVGKLNREWAKELGLKEGLPVVSGGIDAAVATLAGGVTRMGENTAMVGTSLCWGIIHKGDDLDWRLVNFPYVLKGKEYIYSFGGATTAGAVVEWFKNLTCVEDIDEITERAKKLEPGAEGLVLLPFFMGERAPIWNPDARAVVDGMTLTHGTEHLFRAVLESIAFSIRYSMNIAEKIGVKLEDRIRAVGGLTKNELWLEITASMTKKDVMILPTSLDAPFGDAFLSALGVGAIEDTEEIKRWIRWKVVKPKAEWIEKYDLVYERYLNLMGKLGY